MTVSETMTIVVLFHQSGYRTFKHFYMHVQQHLHQESSKLLIYQHLPRESKNSKTKAIFTSFTPAVSKAMRAKTRKDNLRNRSDLDLIEIAKWCNPILQGWLNYYVDYCISELYMIWRHFNKTLIAWAIKKYKSLRRKKVKAAIFIEKIAAANPKLFVHLRNGMIGSFA